MGHLQPQNHPTLHALQRNRGWGGAANLWVTTCHGSWLWWLLGHSPIHTPSDITLTSPDTTNLPCPTQAVPSSQKTTARDGSKSVLPTLLTHMKKMYFCHLFGFLLALENLMCTCFKATSQPHFLQQIYVVKFWKIRTLSSFNNFYNAVWQ